MGTQQILLIILGIIIVGIALTVGTLPQFQKGMESANRDAITQDCLKLAAAAQGYYRRPTLYSGGGNSFDGITVNNLGMDQNASGAGENFNGVYTVDGSNGNSCVITGASKSVQGARVLVTVLPGDIGDPIYEGW